MTERTMDELVRYLHEQRRVCLVVADQLDDWELRDAAKRHRSRSGVYEAVLVFLGVVDPLTGEAVRGDSP